MSGNGRHGGPHYSDQEDCTKVRFRTHLSSPVPEVVATLKVGDTLAVKYQPPRGPLYAQTEKGKKAGSIVTGEQVTLINCINNGYSYKAEVVKIAGGKCELQIKPA